MIEWLVVNLTPERFINLQIFKIIVLLVLNVIQHAPENFQVEEIVYIGMDYLVQVLK